MSTTSFFAVIFMIAIDVLIWKAIRFYDRRGEILAFPKVISRERAPRWFRLNMIVLWIVFGLSVAFTIIVTLALIVAQ